MKISMVTDVCGANDQSFNQSAWEGLLRAKKELGVKNCLFGVKLANPACNILSQYAESLTDAARGKTIASHMYQPGKPMKRL